jgi:hypothetical protein
MANALLNGSRHAGLNVKARSSFASVVAQLP